MSVCTAVFLLYKYKLNNIFRCAFSNELTFEGRNLVASRTRVVGLNSQTAAHYWILSTSNQYRADCCKFVPALQARGVCRRTPMCVCVRVRVYVCVCERVRV